MLAFEPGCPLVEITCTPATSPVSALDNSDGFLLAIRSPLISVAEPVKDLFCCTVSYHHYLIKHLRIGTHEYFYIRLNINLLSLHTNV